MVTVGFLNSGQGFFQPPDPPERLREMLAMARRQGDEKNASRAAAALAEALVARGELDEAAEVVAETSGAPR